MSLSQDWSYILHWPSFVHLLVTLSNCAQGSDWMESVIDSGWLISQQSSYLFEHHSNQKLLHWLVTSNFCCWGSVLNNIAKPKLPLQSAIFFCRGSVWTTLQNRSLILQPAKMLRICVEQQQNQSCCFHCNQQSFPEDLFWNNIATPKLQWHAAIKRERERERERERKQQHACRWSWYLRRRNLEELWERSLCVR